MLTRAELRTLIDRLPDDGLVPVAAAIEQTIDPALRTALLAPEDDEPLTEADRAAIQAAQASLARGEHLTHAEVKRRHGQA